MKAKQKMAHIVGLRRYSEFTPVALQGIPWTIDVFNDASRAAPPQGSHLASLALCTNSAKRSIGQIRVKRLGDSTHSRALARQIVNSAVCSTGSQTITRISSCAL